MREGSQENVTLTHEDYTVGWVCALPKEIVAGTAMLDQVHPTLLQPRNDSNNYTLGRIGTHNIVLTCLPLGETGNNSSASVATHLTSTFPSIKFGIMVGIGGGVPPFVRLGDVVVSAPGNGYGGVVQWDFGKTEQGDGFRRTGALNSPPIFLKTALSTLKAKHEMEGSAVPKYLEEMEAKWPMLAPKYTRREKLEDMLFAADYRHPETSDGAKSSGTDADDGLRSCAGCDRTKLLQRKHRDMRVHYGLIASGNQVVKDGIFRDEINSRLGGNVLCFEMEAAGLMNQFPCVVVRGICDYSDSHKIKNWQEYAAAAAAATAKEILLMIPKRDIVSISPMAKMKLLSGLKRELISETTDAVRDIEDRDLLQRISDLDATVDHDRARAKHVPKTGDWLLHHEMYRKWMDGDSQVLWLHGISGSGKTILTSTVIENLQKAYDNDKENKIAYFYFTFTDSRKSALEGCMRNILRQLSAPSPCEAVRNLYKWECGGRTQQALESVLRAVQDALEPLGRVFLILDALDECEDIAALSSVMTFIRSNTQISLFVTSHLTPETHRLTLDVQASIIEVDAAQVSRDIQAFVNHRLFSGGKSSRRWTDEVMNHIQANFISSSAGMFRLAECQLREIDRCYSCHDLQIALSRLPTTLSKIYEQMLGRIDPAMRQNARVLLTWLTFSFRPLQLQEAAEIFALPIDGGKSSSLDPQRRLLDPNDIISICPGIVTVTMKDSNSLRDSKEELVVQLAHSSVKDFLTSGNFSHGANKWLGIKRTQSHQAIAETCLHYLLQLDRRDSVTPTIRKDFPLAQYAAEFWPSHARLASFSSDSKLQQLMENLFIFRTSAFINWIRIYDHDQPWRTHLNSLHISVAQASPSPLYFASLTGLHAVVSCILANEPTISKSEGLYGNALHAAVSSGHCKIVELLLHHGLRVDTQGPYGSALHAAAYGGQVKICQLLLDHGAEPDAPGEEFGNALEAAIYGGHVKVVQLLLNRGAEVTAAGKLYVDSLHATCSFGNVEILQLLLKQRDIDPLGKSYNRALQVAVDRGCTQMLALLRQHGPSPAYRSAVYGSALHAAAANACTRTMELLLDQDIDIDATEEDHGTALCISASKGDMDSVELLLRRNADITLQGTTGTALYIASGLGHSPIVRLLLQHGANFNSQGGHFGTPLQAACYKGNIEIVRMLLLSGANVNASAGEYGSALHATACGLSAQVEIVQLLLQYGANVQAWNADYGTPLDVALLRQNMEVARLLRGYGARSTR
ncbi:uncharacterized protein N7482_000391 [Penicillium canariense]|uniref:NACHT domain-containing protein n=1 Tax=Penicillium canariense TaxID=189055 RepID=A0A9W9LSW5_9EURO|nr:uncharacterized protein N7482_000391 [Penicillium canariense]KAJ5174514.1 hypothetical protein N7482_000391 [Penicillium canariense]